MRKINSECVRRSLLILACVSPILFAVYLERALRDVRASMPQRPVTNKGLPEKTLYADDADFFSTDSGFLHELKQIIPQIIGLYNLNANKDKWENTTLTEGDDANWMVVKKLGSLLGGVEDIKRRTALANVQFKALEKLWDRPNYASMTSRLHAYNAFVLPVLLYNAGTWGVCQTIIRKLESVHRNHLYITY